jgi:BlaI family penicillinase repressor
MRFTSRELDIMSVLWEHGPSTIAEVRSRLDAEVSHNTVATMLGILEEKGYVAHTREGRAFRFQSLVTRQVAATSALSRIVDTIFSGSAEALLSHFARDRRLTREELKRIRGIIDQRVERDKRQQSSRPGRKS